MEWRLRTRMLTSVCSRWKLPSACASWPHGWTFIITCWTTSLLNCSNLPQLLGLKTINWFCYLQSYLSEVIDMSLLLSHCCWLVRYEQWQRPWGQIEISVDTVNHTALWASQAKWYPGYPILVLLLGSSHPLTWLLISLLCRQLQLHLSFPPDVSITSAHPHGWGDTNYVTDCIHWHVKAHWLGTVHTIVHLLLQQPVAAYFCVLL